jgi:hypothetical protein
LLQALVMACAVLAMVVLGFSARAQLRPGSDNGLERALPSWHAHLQRFDAALAVDRARAARAWQDAWGAALATRQWAPLIAVGDAALRDRESSAALHGPRAAARQAYMAALFRARATGSQEGMLRAAAAFAALGDVDAAEGARRMAEATTR